MPNAGIDHVTSRGNSFRRNILCVGRSSLMDIRRLLTWRMLAMILFAIENHVFPRGAGEQFYGGKEPLP
ncbi:hypothetical protein D3C87_2120400 [compost metagenome]